MGTALVTGRFANRPYGETHEIKNSKFKIKKVVPWINE
jgi:hypothetical protein